MTRLEALKKLDKRLMTLESQEVAALYLELTGKKMRRMNRSSMIDKLAPVLRKEICRLENPSAVSLTPSGKVRKKLSMPFKGRINRYRPGTTKAELATLLFEGRTYEDLMEHFGWSYSYTRQQIWWLHYLHGFGVEEDDDRVIRIHMRKGALQAP